MLSFNHPVQHFSRIDYDKYCRRTCKFSIFGRNITNLQFSDNTDAQAEEEQDIWPWLTVSVKPAQAINWKSMRRRPNL